MEQDYIMVVISLLMAIIIVLFMLRIRILMVGQLISRVEGQCASVSRVPVVCHDPRAPPGADAAHVRALPKQRGARAVAGGGNSGHDAAGSGAIDEHVELHIRGGLREGGQEGAELAEEWSKPASGVTGWNGAPASALAFGAQTQGQGLLHRSTNTTDSVQVAALLKKEVYHGLTTPLQGGYLFC